jgi:hypothetical protein
MARLGGFSALLADLFGDIERRDHARERARARSADARETMERARDTRTFAKAISSISAPLGNMAKETNAMAQRLMTDHLARARERLAEINAQATAAAAAGKLSAEEGAKLDFAIANMARRIDHGY